MGLCRVELVAAVLLWTVWLFLGLVHGQDWTVLSEEEADRIWPRPPHRRPAVKMEANAPEPPIDDPVELIDFSFLEYDDGINRNSSYNTGEEKLSRNKGDASVDPKSSGKSEAAVDPKSTYEKGEASIDPELTSEKSEDSVPKSTPDKDEAKVDAKLTEGEATVDFDLKPPFPGPHEADNDYYDDPYDDLEESYDHTGFDYECSENAFKIALVKNELERLQVIRSKRVLSVDRSSKSCGYVNKVTGIFVVPFKGCFTRKKKNLYSIQLLLTGGTQVRTATCFAPKSARSKVAPRIVDPPAQLTCPFMTTGAPNEPPIGPKTGPKAWSPHPPTLPTSPTQAPSPPVWIPIEPHPVWQTEATQAPPPLVWQTEATQAPLPPVWPTLPPTEPPTLPPTEAPTKPPSPPTRPPTMPPMTQSCPSNNNERLTCSFVGCTETDCLNDGCCWDPYAPYNKRCFYPENECTKDGHFVFTIRYDSAAPYLLNPFSLEIPGTNCGPAIVTHNFAVFIFGMDECGTVHYELGDTSVALAEVQTAVETVNLKYAVISRSSQIRFLIECRHTDGESALASAAYMVLSSLAPVPSAVFFDGLYGVVLSIAKDDTYTEFYETYHPPMSVMLNHRIYLQLELLSPVPEATIVVNYCIGYPRFTKTTTIFLYEGCPNRNDPGTGIFRTIDFQGERNERRFWLDAFQFREANEYLDEDIYIMCSSYVCMHLLQPCPQQCFDA